MELVTLYLRMGFVPSLWNCLFSSVVEHQSRKLGVVGSNPTGGIKYFTILQFNSPKKDYRSWQGSNLRGQSPLDFKSNALTTRPQLLMLSRNTVGGGYRVWVGVHIPEYSSNTYDTTQSLHLELVV